MAVEERTLSAGSPAVTDDNFEQRKSEGFCWVEDIFESTAERTTEVAKRRCEELAQQQGSDNVLRGYPSTRAAGLWNRKRSTDSNIKLQPLFWPDVQGIFVRYSN